MWRVLNNRKLFDRIWYIHKLCLFLVLCNFNPTAYEKNIDLPVLPIGPQLPEETETRRSAGTPEESDVWFSL
jgi:hypothetical protein